ncbi:MAG: hypothetical protein SVS85_04505 [Candidatus Nanohaloarchaea archaeon]|nr:hypothetical protein [Candidatus Nanohaloarchaea archaeon]
MGEDQSSRLHPAMIAAVTGSYLLLTLAGLSTVLDQIVAVLGVVLVGHSLLLFLGFGEGSASSTFFLGYGFLVFLNAVWRGGLSQPWQGLDLGTAALSLLLLWSGVLMLGEEESDWWLP